MKKFGVHIHYMGGETADVGDVVRTIAVNGTMTSRWPKSKFITNEKIKAGDMIVDSLVMGNPAMKLNTTAGSPVMDSPVQGTICWIKLMLQDFLNRMILLWMIR